MKAIVKADTEVQKDYARADAKRWDYAAKFFSGYKPQTVYSAKACEKRYIALMNESATIPPELDDDPQKRADERATRTVAYLERKQEEHVSLLAAKERARLEEERYRLDLATKRQAAAEKRAQRAEEKARRASEIAAKQNANLRASEHKRLARQAELDRAQKAHGERLAQNAKDEEVKARRQAKVDVEQAARDSPRTVSSTRRRNTCVSSSDGGVFVDSRIGSPTTGARSVGSMAPPRTIPKKPKARVASKARASPETASRPSSVESLGSGSDDGAVNSPRASLTIDQLSRVLHERGLPKGGKKADMLERLHKDDMSKHTTQLKENLKASGMKFTGKKTDLIHRLAQRDVSFAAAARHAPTPRPRKEKRASSATPSGSKTKRIRTADAGRPPTTPKAIAAPPYPATAAPTLAHNHDENDVDIEMADSEGVRSREPSMLEEIVVNTDDGQEV